MAISIAIAHTAGFDWGPRAKSLVGLMGFLIIAPNMRRCSAWVGV